MTLARLRRIGAPGLPSPLFYRVKRDAFGVLVTVEVRRPRRYLGSERISKATVAVDVAPTPADVVAVACRLAVSKIATQRLDRALYDGLTELLGDHR